MDELISNVSAKLGIEESVARQAIGAILCFLKEQVADTSFDFDNVTSKMSGAIQLMNEATSKTQKKSAQDRTMDDDSGATETPPAASSFSIVSIITWILTVGPILDILKYLVGMVFGKGAVKMLTSASQSADLLKILQNLGISQDTAKSMVSLMVTFMNEKLGPQVMDQLAESVPALKPFLDATKKEE